MGAIYKHDINKIKDTFNCSYYIETGTGEGICLSHALTHDFKQFFSIEIYDQIYELAKKKFKSYDNCEIIKGNSFDILPNILKLCDGNILFFLDAHFPGADFNYESYDGEKNKDKRLPLEKELDVINENYDINKCVFIVDDLRIYEDGPYEGGNWGDRTKIGGNGIQFVYDMFEKTHTIEKDFRDQGYLIIKPKINEV